MSSRDLGKPKADLPTPLERTGLAWNPPFVQDVVVEAERGSAGAGRVLVFAGTVAAADSTAAALLDVGVRALRYHKEVPAAEREAALAEIASSSSGVVLVCTDSAARGLDIPDVSHVVQVSANERGRTRLGLGLGLGWWWCGYLEEVDGCVWVGWGGGGEMFSRFGQLLGLCFAAESGAGSGGGGGVRIWRMWPGVGGWGGVGWVWGGKGGGGGVFKVWSTVRLVFCCVVW